MLTVIARLKVQEGKGAAFEEAAQALIAYVRDNEPGTIAYTLYRSQADASEYTFYEVYRDPDAFGAHGASPAMMTFFGSAGTLLAGRPEITMMETVAGK